MAERPPLPPPPSTHGDDEPAGLPGHSLPEEPGEPPLPNPGIPDPDTAAETNVAATERLPPSAYATLSVRRKRFVDAYVRYGVGTDAYHEVFPEAARPDVGASKLLSIPDVWAAVQERDGYCSMLAGITKTRLKIEMARVAFADPGQIMDENGETLPLNKIPLETRVAIAGVDVEDIENKKGERIGRRYKYRFSSKTEILRLLVQTESMIVERHVHTGEGGGPIKTASTSVVIDAKSADDLTDEQLQAIARAGLPTSPKPETGAN